MTTNTVQWVGLPKKRSLECSCGSDTFKLSHEAMARQAKTPGAHQMRVVARCSACEAERRVDLRYRRHA